MKTLRVNSFFGLLLSFFLWHSTGYAADATSANGKYSGLVQQLNCPSDAAKYGNFNDYGYWDGGAWCGQQGKAGYWVWVNPTWYIWANKAADAAADATSANGKYSDLLQVLNCPKDAAKYGSYSDYGYWQGGAWCGQQGKAGYWVWVSPNWYVWSSTKP